MTRMDGVASLDGRRSVNGKCIFGSKPSPEVITSHVTGEMEGPHKMVAHGDEGSNAKKVTMR